MKQRVLDYIKEHKMIESFDRLVLGVSGGADSVALLYLLRELKEELSLELFIAHIDHGIRGRQAMDDANFVRELARDLSLDFFLKEADIPGLSKELGLSEEEAGRKVRYDFFEELRIELGAQRVALAHHKDDQAETILHNLIRGTGLKGLTGIRPVRDNIIRPLLDISRADIEDYCRKKGLSFKDDHTNWDTIYTRNRIRHKLIPSIREDFNPSIVDSLTSMADLLRVEDDFLTIYSRETLDNISQKSLNSLIIDLKAFRPLDLAIKRRIVREAIHYIKKDLYGLGQVHIDSIVEFSELGLSGSQIDLPFNMLARLDFSSLIIEEARLKKLSRDFSYKLEIPGELYLEELGLKILISESDNFIDDWSTKDHVLDGDNRFTYIDGDEIGKELELRNRRPGDRMKPLGMTGSKKLKDIFIDKKISAHKRDSIPLIVKDQDIIWIAGLLLNEDYRVKRTSKRLIRLEIWDKL